MKTVNSMIPLRFPALETQGKRQKWIPRVSTRGNSQPGHFISFPCIGNFIGNFTGGFHEFSHKNTVNHLYPLHGKIMETHLYDFFPTLPWCFQTVNFLITFTLKVIKIIIWLHTSSPFYIWMSLNKYFWLTEIFFDKKVHECTFHAHECRVSKNVSIHILLNVIEHLF